VRLLQSRKIIIFSLLVFALFENCYLNPVFRGVVDPVKKENKLNILAGLFGIMIFSEGTTLVLGQLVDLSGSPISGANLEVKSISASVRGEGSFSQALVSNSTITDSSGNFYLYSKAGISSISVLSSGGINLGAFNLTVADPSSNPTASLSLGALFSILNLRASSAIPPSNLIYSGSFFSFTAGTAISKQTPAFNGIISSCTASPSLPTGLSISSTTCAISGTPTTVQSATIYTITAGNPLGSTTATVSITVTSAVVPPSSLTYSGSPYSFMVGSAISTIVPTYSGTVTNCNASPTLPTGLSISLTSCAISGTPTTVQSAKNYTITASNSGGSASATINITVSAVPTYTIGGSVVGCFISACNGAGTFTLTNSVNSDTVNVVAGDGGIFTFPIGLTSLENYNVTVTLDAFPNYACTVTGNGSGTIASANVTNIVVTCNAL